MTAMSKRSLISKSVVVIRTGIHPIGEEPDDHVICVAPRVSRTTTMHEVPTRSKLGLYSRDEVLTPSDCPTAWASSCVSHSSSNKPPQSRKRRFDKVVTKLLCLPGSIKPDMRSVQIKACPLGNKTMRTLINTGWIYHLETLE
jgi:hypothetical protein